MLARRIKRTEVYKQGREENECCRVEKSDRQIEIVVRGDRRVEIENERGQTERREVERVRCSSALFEQDKEADQQKQNTDQVDIQDARSSFMNRAEVIEISPVLPRFDRI